MSRTVRHNASRTISSVALVLTLTMPLHAQSPDPKFEAGLGIRSSASESRNNPYVTHSFDSYARTKMKMILSVRNTAIP